MPTFSEVFSKKIEAIVNIAFLQSQESQQIYASAETLVLESIGLKDFEFSMESVNVKSFKESFITTGRLDSEFYQKKYEEIEFEIKRNSKTALLCDTLLRIETGEYSPVYYSKDEIPDLTFYIRSTNIKGGQVNFDDIFSS